MTNKLLTNLLLTLGSLLFTLLILEAAFRLFAPGIPAPVVPNINQLQSVIVFDPVLESFYRPGASTTIQSQYGEFTVHYTLNEVGLRAHSLSSCGNRYRILVLGNSFVEGWGVEQKDSFINIAETQLNRQYRTRFPEGVCFMNAGISGFGASQSLLLMTRLLPQVKPDQVVFFYLPTMIHADAKFLSHARINKQGIAQGVDLQKLLATSGAKHEKKHQAQMDLLNQVSRYSALVAFFVQRLHNYEEQQRIKPGDPLVDILAGLRGKNLPKLHQPSLQHVREMATRLKQAHIPFVVISMPLPHQLSAWEWPEGRQTYGLKAEGYPNLDEPVSTAFYTRNQIDWLSAGPFLSAHIAQKGTDAKLYYRYDFHLNQRGNRLLGEWFATQLAQSHKP